MFTHLLKQTWNPTFQYCRSWDGAKGLCPSLQERNCIRYHLSPIRMAINENLQTIHAGEGVGKKEPSYAVGRTINWYSHYGEQYAASALLQSCPTLCDPIDGSSPGSAVPGILQARTLEWVAISFSSAWKWKVKVKSLSCVGPSATPWTGAYQAPLSMGFSMQEYWSGLPLPSPGE